MNLAQSLRRFIRGAPLDPLSAKTRHSIALAAFFAWVGLGADGISSSAYGPEEAFRALEGHHHLGLYLALATVLTVFIIALAYNQVIELFPTGGGGYRVATHLVGRHAGLVSGALCTTQSSACSGSHRRTVRPRTRRRSSSNSLRLRAWESEWSGRFK